LTPDQLRGLAEGATKGTSHSIAIPESGQLRDNVKRVVCVLQQRARSLKAEVLDRFGRCLAGFKLKGAAKLARREMRDLGKIFHTQLAGKIAPGVGEDALNPVGFRF
jgi:hypothetical protein